MEDRGAPATVLVSEISEATEPARKPAGWVLYDARCPLCSRGARRLGCVASHRGYRLTPLQRRWIQDLLSARPGEVGDEMMLLLPDGRLFGGIDAYLQLARHVWWARPLAALAWVPGVRAAAGALYRWIARNRYRISGACGLGRCG